MEGLSSLALLPDDRAPLKTPTGRIMQRPPHIPPPLAADEFAALVNRHQHALHAYLAGLIGNHEQAFDLVARPADTVRPGSTSEIADAHAVGAFLRNLAARALWQFQWEAKVGKERGVQKRGHIGDEYS